MNGFGSQSGGSLFGQQSNPQSGGGLFGNSSNNAFGSAQSSQPSLGTAGSTFGAKRTQSVGGMFGSNAAGSSSNTGGLFGSSTPTTSQGSGLFGSNTAGSNPSGSSLFGANNNTNTSGGLFGSNSKPAGTAPFGSAASNPQGGSLFGQNNQQAPGNATANNSTQSGGLFGQSNQQNSAGGSLFGKPPAAPGTSSGGLFGSSQPSGSNLFGQNQNQSQPQGQQSSTGLFGGGANTGGTAQRSGGLFGGSTSNNPPASTGGGLFGNTSSSASNTNTGGLFGASNTSNTGTSLGGNSGGGLFGSTNLNSGASTTGGGSGGLFGNSNSGGGLFGSKPAAAPASGGFGSAQPQGQQQQQQQQPLLTTIDNASYILQGVQPSQKLYTSLTQPAQKRTNHEARGYTSYGTKSSFKASPVKSSPKPLSTHLAASKSSPMTIAGPSLVDPGIRQAATAASLTHAEPRQWINSYDRFLKERPTTLVIKRDERRLVALPSPPVSTAPPPIASVAAESSTHNLKSTRESTFAGDKSTGPIEPDVSLFHRQANNMTVVQVSKKSLEEGYYIFPRLEALSAMSKAQLAAVPNLVVGREKYGQIEYSGTVDLSRIPNLGDILGALVVFEAGTVCVYPDEETKALPGHELNLPCTVTIENAWPIDAATRKKITDMEDPRMQKHIARLREKCEADGGEFVTFAQGMWVFKVPHFSKWGLPAEEMIIDTDDDNLISADRDDSPVFVVVDGNGEAKSAEMDGLESDDLMDKDMDSEDPSEPSDDLQSWQDQLSHAAFSCYSASQDALTAAAQLPEKKDLGAVLLPSKLDGASAQNKTKDQRVKTQQTDLSKESMAAVLGSLRFDTLKRHTRKSPRDHSSLPQLHTEIGVDVLKSLSPERKDLWSLIATLYSPDGLNADMLSKWLEQKTSSISIASNSDDLDAIWQMLTTHRLLEAVQRALKSNNPHLAVLISLFDNQNASASDAEQQLRYWKESRTLSSIPIVVRHIWELASGAAPAPLGLTWSQWLGMRLWYSHCSVEEAVSKVPASLVNGSGPEFSLIRNAIGQKQLKSVVEELNIVEAFLFLQVLDSVSPLTSKQDVKCYDSVCSSLAETLQNVGEANPAVYVGLHIKDTKQCLDIVHKILVEASDSVSLNLTQDLGVPEQLLDEARAAHSRNVRDFQSGAEYLLRAGLYEQAHELVLANVAPQAVLDGRVLEIENLLLSLETQKEKLRHWSLGGDVYLLYLRGLKAGDSVERYDVKSLCNSCRYANTPNLESKAAISIISQWAASTSFAKKDFEIDVVLNMKFDPSQTRLIALQQAARLME